MNILLIEDEIKTAKALAALILVIKPEAKIAGSIQSIETAVTYLSENPPPDLIFMDIQLADGLCFDIFKLSKIVSPVIFCTAYDDYTIDAFKTNGIDYILKPFSKETITAAFDKLSNLKSFFQQTSPQSPTSIQSPTPHTIPLDAIENLLNKTTGNTGKKSFLVFKGTKYIIVPTETIAFFYIKNEVVTIVNFDAQEYGITQSLDEVHTLLDTNQFFRVNRQYLINFKAIAEVEHYFSRKLFVKLTINTPDKVLVGKEKVTTFLNWLEK